MALTCGAPTLLPCVCWHTILRVYVRLHLWVPREHVTRYSRWSLKTHLGALYWKWRGHHKFNLLWQPANFDLSWTQSETTFDVMQLSHWITSGRDVSVRMFQDDAQAVHLFSVQAHVTKLYRQYLFVPSCESLPWVKNSHSNYPLWWTLLELLTITDYRANVDVMSSFLFVYLFSRSMYFVIL